MYSLSTLLTCHGLEDFPTHHTGDQANGLLVSLTALWHPAILARAKVLPSWCRVDQVPEDCSRAILLSPSIITSQLPTGFAERVAGQNGFLVHDVPDRARIVAQVLMHWGEDPARADPENLANDFHALGFVYWQVKLMTRQLRYSSHLDEVHFQNLVLAAATAFVTNQWHICRSNLQASFDLLLQERNRYFPVDALFIDLVLVAPTTIGESFGRNLQIPTAINLLMSGELAEQIAVQHSEWASDIKSRIEAGTLEIVGGPDAERRLALMSIESVRHQVECGHQKYERSLGNRPRYFGRRRFGLTDSLPQVLLDFGYRGAIHAPFDQGKFPPSAAGSIEWQSADGSTIPAISQTPIDADRSDAFMRLGVGIGESFDSAHGATVLFAHWPMKTCTWFDDLMRSTKYGAVLGRFVTIKEYFQHSPFSGHRERYTDDQYRSQFLSEAQLAGQVDPLSCVCDYWRNRLALAQCGPLQFMACVLKSSAANLPEAAKLIARIPSLDAANERLVDGPENLEAAPTVEGLPTRSDLSESIGRIQCELADSILTSLIGPLDETVGRGSVPRSASSAQLIVVNPLSFARRVVCPASAHFESVQLDKIVYAADVDSRGGYLAVDVPPFGYAMVSAHNPRRSSRKPDPLIVEGFLLRNEFFEVAVDEWTGGIRSIHTYQQRGNHFSQTLSLRLPPGHRTSGGLDATYAQAVARSIETSGDNRVVGEITVRGELVIDEKPAADFVQRCRVSRGRRIVELDIELSPREKLTVDPWRHYLCSRFAWPSEAAELWRSVNQTRCAIAEPRFEAPNYIEIVDGSLRFAVLTNGLPFHRRYDYRKLDCLLQVSGENRTHFRLGIGVNLPSAQQAAEDFASSPLFWEREGQRRIAQPAAWLMRVDCRNLLVTAIEPLGTTAFGDGVRVRLKETEGRAGNGRLECARPFRQAHRVKLDGEAKSELNVNQGNVEFGFAANEYMQFDLLW